GAVPVLDGGTARVGVGRGAAGVGGGDPVNVGCAGGQPRIQIVGDGRTGRGDRRKVRPVGGPLDVERRGVGSVIRPFQIDLRVGDRGGREIARRGRRQNRAADGGGAPVTAQGRRRQDLVIRAE